MWYLRKIKIMYDIPILYNQFKEEKKNVVKDLDPSPFKASGSDPDPLKKWIRMMKLSMKKRLIQKTQNKD